SRSRRSRKAGYLRYILRTKVLDPRMEAIIIHQPIVGDTSRLAIDPQYANDAGGRSAQLRAPRRVLAMMNEAPLKARATRALFHSSALRGAAIARGMWSTRNQTKDIMPRQALARRREYR